MSVLRWAPLVLIVALLGVFAFRIFTDRPSEGSFALVGAPAPEFVLPALAPEQGFGLAHADLIGGRPTIVNVWASWCPPCVLEHPLLMELARDPTIQVVGIVFEDEPENARAFLEARGNPFARLGVDRDGRVSFDWGVTGPPETFVVAPDGTIIAKHVGPLTPDVIRQTIRPALEQARQRSP